LFKCAQLLAGPPQTPPVHVSGSEQKSPSSHGVPFWTGVSTLQLPAGPLGSHDAVLQASPAAEQLVPAPGMHVPPTQASPSVHAFASVHVLLSSGVNTHCPFDGLQESSVHVWLSLHTVPVPGTQAPPEH